MFVYKRKRTTARFKVGDFVARVNPMKSGRPRIEEVPLLEVKGVRKTPVKFDDGYQIRIQVPPGIQGYENLAGTFKWVHEDDYDEPERFAGVVLAS